MYIFYVLWFCSYFDVLRPLVLPLTEAERLAEQLLGPYTGEEHSKRANAVHDRRLNRAYRDPAVRLLERPDPDAGKKKRARGPEELEGTGPISAVPIRAIGGASIGKAGFAAGCSVVPSSKRASREPGAPRQTSSAASSSAGSLAAPVAAPVTEAVASSFGIASMALDDVSGGTPSQVYGDGTEDTVVEPRDDLRAATGKAAPLRTVCELWLTWLYLQIVTLGAVPVIPASAARRPKRVPEVGIMPVVVLTTRGKGLVLLPLPPRAWQIWGLSCRRISGSARGQPLCARKCATLPPRPACLSYSHGGARRRCFEAWRRMQ